MEHITNEQLNIKIEDHVKQHNIDAEQMNKKLDKVAGIWWKIGAIVLIPFLTGIFAYGKLTSDVEHLQTDVTLKANKETVETQLASMALSLQQINTKLDSLTVIKTK